MVCGNFILPEPASYVFFYAVFNLRKLLYLIWAERHGIYRDSDKSRLIAVKKAKKAAAVYRYLADNNGEWVARIALTMKLARQRSFVLRSGTR